MRNQGQYILGVALIIAGLIFILGRVLDINAWRILWPVLLIGIGTWLLIRHRQVDADTQVNQKLFGDIRRNGEWSVAKEEYNIIAGDIELDMTQAHIPTGETRIRIFGVFGDIDVLVPKTVGITVTSTGVITDAKILEEKRDVFFSSTEKTSANFEKAKQKIRLETTFFIGDVTVKQV